MCADCAAAGNTLRDGGVYACNLFCGCQRVLGRQFFEPKQIKNFKERGGRLWCNECSAAKGKEKTQHEEQAALNEAERKGVDKGGVQCARVECAKEHFEPTWAKQDRHDLRRGKKKSICADCKKEAYTPRDLITYMCDGEQCDCKGGVQKISPKSIFRYKKSGRKQATWCVTCAKPKNVQGNAGGTITESFPSERGKSLTQQKRAAICVCP